MTEAVRMNLGSGRDYKPGWINVDFNPDVKADLRLDLDAHPISYMMAPEDSVDEFLCSHTIEHMQNPLWFLESMWKAAKPGAVAEFRTPYGSSDDADEDPTHVRRMFINSWFYFSQPAYWRADYGYRGDWRTKEVKLRCYPWRMGNTDQETLELIHMERNVVAEMVATLVAVKPIRPPEKTEDKVLITIEAAG